MRTLGIAASLAAVYFSPSIARADGLTIEDAVRLALTRNERAAIAELDVVIAEAEVSRARVAFLPVLGATASDVVRPREPSNVVEARVSVTQSLLEPAAFPRLSRAKHTLAAQRAQSVDDKRLLAFETASAFMSVLLADQVVQAAQRKLDTARANLADTEAQVRAQLVSTNDVTRAQISLGSAARDLAANQGRLRSSYVQLAFVINERISGTLAPPIRLLVAGTQLQPTGDELVATSVARRPDLVARKEVVMAALDAAREPRRQYLPSLGLAAQLTATTADSGRSVDGQIALTASWTIFDGGTRSAEIRSRDAQAAIANLEAVALARSIDADVRAAATELAGAQQALVAARDAREAARKSAGEAAILYRQGLAKAIELLDANDQRFIAEVNYASVEFDVASAYLALRRAMGLDPLEVR